MKLTDIAGVIRSKNAGPYMITLDILFKDKTIYEQFKSAGLMTKETAAELYGISEDSIQSIIFLLPKNL